MSVPSIVRLIRTACGKLILGAGWLRSPFLLFVRLYWGWQFFQAGYGKLHKLPDITDFFQKLGIPLPGFNAVLASTTECVGGLLLMLGLASRLTAIPLTITMIVAYVTADSDALHAIFSKPDDFTAAAPFSFLFASLVILIFGPGCLSLDALLGRRFGKCGPDPGEP